MKQLLLCLPLLPPGLPPGGPDLRDTRGGACLTPTRPPAASPHLTSRWWEPWAMPS